MDKMLDARFERVEKALANLIDSIAKYNPSEKLAEDLAAADRDLSSGLKELERHQNNYARLQQLRQETAALDDQTKNIIGALWNMRKEVKNTPATHYPPGGPKYKFTTAELLSYARRISRNTLPPPGTTNGFDFGSPTSGTGTPRATTQEMTSESQAQTPNASFNGGNTAAGTPAASAPTPSAAANGNASFGPGMSFSDQPGAPNNNTVAAANLLPHHLKARANPLDGSFFYPWPTEDNIRASALAAYQTIVDRNMDPKGYDPEEIERRRLAEEQARLEQEEAERRERIERDRARELERREEAARRAAEMAAGGGNSGAGGSGGAGAAPAQPKGQFQFLDDDDDDDD